jgi:CspA family cold shock protein
MAIGTVKWFNENKGTGLIRAKDGQNVYVHFSALEGEGFRTLASGEKVAYDVVITAKGLTAVNVKILTTTEK